MLLGLARPRSWVRTARLLQRQDVDGAAPQDGAAVEVDLVDDEAVDHLLHGGAGAGEKARAHLVADAAETQVDARRLQLLFLDWRLGAKLAAVDEALDCLVGQDAAAGGQLRQCLVLEEGGGWHLKSQSSGRVRRQPRIRQAAGFEPTSRRMLG